MKIKLFLIDVFPYLLIGLSCLLSFKLLDSMIILLFYSILFKEYNRVGFINRICIIYSLLYILILFLSYSLMLIVMRLVILGLVLSTYTPHRDKVKKLLKLISFNYPMNVYNNRIEYNHKTLYFELELMEKELDWLCRQILLRSRNLKIMKIEYMNNEYLGRNYYVNIS